MTIVITDLLGPGNVQAQNAFWLLRTVAVEMRTLACSRQAGHLARLLGLMVGPRLEGMKEPTARLVSITQSLYSTCYESVARDMLHKG